MGTAILSPDGRYRYFLTRDLLVGKGRCLFIMLNPSTADAQKNDQTIKVCMGFSKIWGFGELAVVNLFALRSTDPQALYGDPDPVGPENDAHILRAAAEADAIVAAWGAHGAHLGRAQQVLTLLKGREIKCLGKTKDGNPRHPLKLTYKTPRIAV